MFGTIVALLVIMLIYSGCKKFSQWAEDRIEYRKNHYGISWSDPPRDAPPPRKMSEREKVFSILAVAIFAVILLIGILFSVSNSFRPIDTGKTSPAREGDVVCSADKCTNAAISSEKWYTYCEDHFSQIQKDRIKNGKNPLDCAYEGCSEVPLDNKAYCYIHKSYSLR